MPTQAPGTGCRLCSDICYSGACWVNKEVSIKELVDSKKQISGRNTDKSQPVQ